MAYDFNELRKIVLSNTNKIISPQDLSDEVDKALILLSKNINTDVIQAFQYLSNILVQYKTQLEIYYKKFLVANRMYNQIKNYTIQFKHNDDDQDKSVKLPVVKKQYVNNRQATIDFIKCLELGRNILTRIREIITQQKIETMITVQTSDSLYRIPESVLQGNQALQTVLSVYGANKNSIFSLAYKIDKKALSGIANLQEYLIQEGKAGTGGDDIYKSIWKAKLLYLEYLSKKKKRRYTPVFNSKDAEIYNLMQTLQIQDSSWLTRMRYGQLRASMGGGGGYRTSQIQLGDVGLVQDKMIGKNTDQVNLTSFGFIYNNIDTLSQTIKKCSNDPQKFLQGLLHQFTEKKHLIQDKISYMANEEAKKNIRSLFQ